MTIAYNSAYIQTWTLNFTFARQAIIVKNHDDFQYDNKWRLPHLWHAQNMDYLNYLNGI